MTKSVRWGIIGPGKIARTFATGIADSETGVLHAVGSRNLAAAESFGDEFQALRRYGSYDEVLTDSEIDAVYIATPHTFHAEWAIRAAEAGKHVLVEKPIGINHAEAMAVVEAARRHDVCLLEGYVYRNHPQTQRIVELIQEGAIGAVRVIEASFGFRIDVGTEHRLLNHSLAGGGILDVGGYPVSISRLIAGAAIGADFADPIEVFGAGHIGAKTRVDEWAVATLKFPGDIVAQAMTAVRVPGENIVRIFGDEGSLVVSSPWTVDSAVRKYSILVRQSKNPEPQEIVVETDRNTWAIEVDNFAAHIDRRQVVSPGMTWNDSLGNAQTLDRWRQAINLTYDAERIESPVKRLPARPLAYRAQNKMATVDIPGVDKPVSRLVMGADNQRTIPHAAVMFDDFFERGGNCFDTAYIYMSGLCEKNLGRWVEDRGVREQVVILGKGAHTPFCTPEGVTSQLTESLERLRTDYVDIYMLHRDNPAIPVGEFVDVLNELKRAGRLRVFGGSNWSIERLDAANDYARHHGLAGFAAVSNNFSLARMVEPPWTGCISSAGERWREWLVRTQTPLMPWSSQARGFFTGRAKPDDRSDPELVRCWYSDDNFERLARAEQLATQRGVSAIVIALAWVLAQPFATFPLIGPRALDETRTSTAALDINLTPTEVAWLNLED